MSIRLNGRIIIGDFSRVNGSIDDNSHSNCGRDKGPVGREKKIVKIKLECILNDRVLLLSKHLNCVRRPYTEDMPLERSIIAKTYALILFCTVQYIRIE